MLLPTLLLAVFTAPTLSQQPAPQDPGRAAEQVTNGLGVDLYQALAKAAGNSNLCLSPYSIAIACMMTAEGARDETVDEMKRTLHCANATDLATVHAAFAALAKRLRDGAGDANPELQTNIATLRQQLQTANQKAEKLGRGDDYRAANDAALEAQRTADEINRLLPQIGRYELRVANALWVERSFGLLPSYATAVDRWYGTGGVHALDIVGNPETARQQINGWIETNTNRRIQNLIPAGGLAADTRLVISNAVWFLGEWAEPFTVSSTEDQDFLMPRGQRIKVPLMRDRHREAVPYAAFTGKGQFFATPVMVPGNPPQRSQQQPATYPDDAGFTMVELPYKGGELAMVVLAPRTPGGLVHLESMLTAASLTEWLGQMKPRAVDTALPRFRLSSGSDLSSSLQALGMRRAFTSPGLPNGAQFGGISDSPDPTQQLFIGSVLHKAWIEVNEKGTEAAAATALMMPCGAAMPDRTMVPFTPVFRADRPFLFVIRDRQSGAILFLGRHVDPRA